MSISSVKHRLPHLRLGILLLLAVVLTACGGVAGGSWAGISSDLDGEMILVSYNQTVTALNAVSGAVLWEYPDEDNRNAQFFAVPVADNGSVYVGDYSGRLHAIDSETGAAQWVYEPERETLIGPLSPEAPDRVISGVALSPDPRSSAWAAATWWLSRARMRPRCGPSRRSTAVGHPAVSRRSKPAPAASRCCSSPA